MSEINMVQPREQDVTRSNINVIKWQDLQLENEPLRQQFMQYFREGYYFQAIDLIKDNIDDINSEAFLPDVFNTLNSALVYLQNLYYNSVEVVLEEDQKQFQYMINTYMNKKAFDSTVAYEPYNFVIYNELIYLCIKNTTPGILPTNTTYWVLVGLKGEIGATSIDVQLRYEWDYQITYSPKDVVVYNNILYVARLRNNNSQPDINPVDWEVFLTIPRAKVIVSPKEPNSEALGIGGQWWKIDEIHDTVETEGINLQVSDSAQGPIDSLSIYGNTEQFTTTGAQLIPYPYFRPNNYVSHGLTFTVNDKGVFTNVKGTISDDGFPTFIMNTDFKLPKGVYSKTVIPANRNFTFGISRYTKDNVFDGGEVNNNQATFDTTNWDYDTYIYKTIFQTLQPKGTVVDVSNFEIMINSGTTLKPFEPWTNELPSPSVDFPQPIEGFGYNTDSELGKFAVTTTGLNWFYTRAFGSSYSNYGVTITNNNNDGTFTVSGTGNITGGNFSYRYYFSREESLRFFDYLENNLGENNSIYLNLYKDENKGKTNVYPYFFFIIVSGSVNSYQVNSYYTDPKRPVTQDIIDKAKADENALVTVGFWGTKDQPIIPGTFKPIVTVGEDYVPWVPYSGIPSTAYVTTSTPFYKIGNYAIDYLTRSYNQWVINRQIRKITLNGDINYIVNNELTKTKQIIPLDIYSKIVDNNNQSFYSDKFRWVKDSLNIDEDGIMSLGGDDPNYRELCFRIPIDADPNEYMNLHPTTIIYIPYSNYPIVESLQNNPSAIELSNLETYNPSTKVKIHSEIECTKLGLGYKVDIDTYMKNNYNN